MTSAQSVASIMALPTDVVPIHRAAPQRNPPPKPHKPAYVSPQMEWFKHYANLGVPEFSQPFEETEVTALDRDDRHTQWTHRIGFRGQGQTRRMHGPTYRHPMQHRHRNAPSAPFFPLGPRPRVLWEQNIIRRDELVGVENEPPAAAETFQAALPSQKGAIAASLLLGEKGNGAGFAPSVTAAAGKPSEVFNATQQRAGPQHRAAPTRPANNNTRRPPPARPTSATSATREHYMRRNEREVLSEMKRLEAFVLGEERHAVAESEEAIQQKVRTGRKQLDPPGTVRPETASAASLLNKSIVHQQSRPELLRQHQHEGGPPPEIVTLRTAKSLEQLDLWKERAGMGKWGVEARARAAAASRPKKPMAAWR